MINFINVSIPISDYKDTEYLGDKVAYRFNSYIKDNTVNAVECIVSKDKKILSVGYNGAPNGYDDKHMPWDREGDFMNTKYAYVCHAELNAILNNKGSNLEGATIYVDLFPCNECAKAIIQCGIKEIVYKSDKYNGTDGNIV